MNQNLRIVRASTDHLDPLAPLLDAYRRFYEQPGDLERARAFLRERLTKGESVVFLAFCGEAPVGFTQLYPSFSSVSLLPIWILNDLYVDPQWRGKRTGERLLEEASGFARASGAKSIQLETATDNLSAQRLYERYGYRRNTGFYAYSWLIAPKNEESA